MQRSSSPLSPYLALMAALCFGVEGIAPPHRGLPEALLGACVLLASLSLVMNLRITTSAPWDRQRRR